MRAVYCIGMMFAAAAMAAAQDTIFIGTWRTSGGEYYRFNTDGTGGIASSADAFFGDDFSFLVWNGTGETPGYPRQNTLGIISGDTTDPAAVRVRLYRYTTGNGTVSLREPGGETIVFTRITGSPAPLDLTPHPLLGQWEAKWNGQNHSGALGTWSFLYRPDGTVRTYHHRLHQFDNAYVVRGDVLVIIGEWRFHPALPVNVALLTVKHRDTVGAREAGGTTWDYVRKERAAWRGQ